jgi:hypothetical protein
MISVRRGWLSDYFDGVAAKRLSSVETDRVASNQHEFNGSGPLRKLFGDSDRRNIYTRFIWIGDEQEGISEEGSLSWYDARRQHPTRTEYRLYYPDNPVTALMKSGDVFFIALRPDGTAIVVIAPEESTIQYQLMWLFGLESQPGFSFVSREITREDNAELDFASRFILEEIGIDLVEPEAELLDRIIQPFGLVFPATRVLSALARESLSDISPLEDPDEVLLAWMEREEQLFRRLERRVVDARLRSGFLISGNADVDGFLGFSLSVQNRRKARAGQALENHLEALFTARGKRFARGAETENRNKPDFIFPGQSEYRDLRFPQERLTMLGAKSTLKDRWRQVLSEAQRIATKHLVTLEPSISVNQTDEMRAKNLQLVVPSRLHSTYRADQRDWIFTLTDFLELVDRRQGY